MTTVRPSSARVMSVILSHPSWVKAPKSGFMMIFQESITSWPVSGSPLWNVTPGRSLKV
jgi:hypothetical protein